MSFNREQWTLTKEKWTVAGGIELTLSDKNRVLELMSQDVPHWDSQLYTIPHLTRIRRKDLFSEQDRSYDSEVAQVYHCLSGVPNLTGIAFHSYSNNQAKKTFDGVEKDFEIDWIFVNISGVFLIEVGYAKDASNSQNIINEKVKQITTRSKQFVASILSASKLDMLVEKDVRLIVALPNTPILELKKWMRSEDNQKIANENSLLFFTKETLTTKAMFHLEGSSLTEFKMESLFQQSSILQTELKYLSALFVVGNHGILKPDASYSYSSKQRKYVDRKNELGNFLEGIEFPDNIVLTSEQYNCVRDIVLGKEKSFLIVGEAGTGKSTVLLLLLVYYAGKKQKDEKKMFCCFGLPQSKWNFYEFVVDFVEKFCDEDFVYVFSGFSALNVEALRRMKIVVLIDEGYDDNIFRTNAAALSVKSHKTVCTLISSGQSVDYESPIRKRSFLNSSTVQTFFMRKWLRNSVHIATVAAKLKRTLNLESGNFITLFDSACPNSSYFAGKSQYQVKVEKLDNGLKFQQDRIISYQKSFQSNFCRAPKNAAIHRVQQNNGSLQDWDFTGVEALTVAVLIDLPELPIGEELNALLSFLYSAITRARIDVVVYCSYSVFNYVKRILELDFTDKALCALQSGRSLSSDELQRCWPNDVRQLAFMLSAVRLSDFNLSQQIFSLILRDPTVVFSTFGLDLIKNADENLKKNTISALFINFALLNPDKSNDVHGYIEQLCKGLSANSIFCYILTNSEFFGKILSQVNCWNASEDLLEKYEHLVPLDETRRLNSPDLTALWFIGEDKIAECHPDSWDFDVIYRISFSLLVTRRFDVAPTLISKLQELLARNDEEARNFKSGGGFFDVVYKLFHCFSQCSQFSLLGLMIKSIPECLQCRGDEQNWTILHTTAAWNDPSIFEIISKDNLDNLFTFDNSNNTPLDVAYISQSNRVICHIFDSYLDLYLQRGEPQKYPFSVILSAMGDIDRLKNMLAERPDCMYAVNRESDPLNCLQIACQYGQAEVVEYLLTLNGGALSRIDYRPEYNPIVFACFSGSIQFLKMLVPRYMNVNNLSPEIIFHSAFLSAATTRNKMSAVEMIKHLVHHDRIDVIRSNAPAQNLLSSIALINRNHALIQFLGAHLDKPENKWTVSDCAKVIIEASRECSGQKPLQKDKEYFSSLGSSIFAFEGAELLFMFTMSNNISLITLCQNLKHKIDDSLRRQILMIACAHENGLEVVRYFSIYHPHLLKASVNDDDETPFLRIARRYNQTEVVNYLIKHHPALLIQVYSKFFDVLLVKFIKNCSKGLYL